MKRKVEMNRVWRNALLLVLPLLIAVALLTSSCGRKELEIQADFGIEAKVVRVPGGNGRKVEIHIKIKQIWPYDGARYFVQYVPEIGNAFVSFAGVPLLQANQAYPLPVRDFVVSHSSEWGTIQKFKMVVTDNLGNLHEVEFHFEIEIPDTGGGPER